MHKGMRPRIALGVFLKARWKYAVRQQRGEITVYEKNRMRDTGSSMCFFHRL